MLKSIILNQYKGVRSGRIDFTGNPTCLCGKNGSCKTTYETAHYWLWADKDATLQSNPDVRPLNMSESEPSVAEIHEINGKEYIFKKIQSDIRTKKQKEDGAPVRISNGYEINGVPKSQKDFMKEVAKIGIDIDNFLKLSHIDYLLGMKIDDRRAAIFPLAGDVSTAEVAEIMVNCDEVKELIAKGFRDDEIIAMAKSDAKKATEFTRSIPDQILGLEKAKVPEDAGLNDRMVQLEAYIADRTKERDECVEKSNTAYYDEQIRALENKKRELYNQANTDRLVLLSEAHKAADKANEAYRDVQNTIGKIKRSGEPINDGFRRQSEIKRTLTAKIDVCKKMVFEGRTVCPTCGQDIPEADIEKAKASWEEQRDNTLKDLSERLNAAETMVNNYRKEGKELVNQKVEAEKQLEAAEEELKKQQQVVLKLQSPIYPDCAEIDAEIKSLNEQKAEVEEMAKKADSITIEIRAAKTELADVIKKLGQISNNQRIDEEIEGLKAKLSDYAQAKADAENVLYQMQQISMRKNELLSDKVNACFTRVRWRLFVTLKNGEVKDDCTPLVLCADGRYRDITYSANTAAIQAAKVDICRGLQKFHGQDLPVWVDGAECFDEKNRAELGKMDTQLILLCVTEDEKLTVR